MLIKAEINKIKDIEDLISDIKDKNSEVKIFINNNTLVLDITEDREKESLDFDEEFGWNDVYHV